MTITVKKIAGKEALLHKVIFELRYDYGFLYLDRCGSLVNSIMELDPLWILANTSPNPQNAPLINLDNYCSFNFSALKMDFSIEQELGKYSIDDDQVDTFITQVDTLTGFVRDTLELKKFNRMGFRIFYLFECSNKEESEDWLSDLKIYKVEPNFITSFHGNIKGQAFSTIIESDDRFFRLQFNSVERTRIVDLGTNILNIPSHKLSSKQDEHLAKQIREKKKKSHNPHYAAMIDIDVYQDKPDIVNPKEFIISSYPKVYDCLKKYSESINKGE